MLAVAVPVASSEKTWATMGAGAGMFVAGGGVKFKAARAAGIGLDADTERARVEARVAARSPWAVEDTRKCHDLGRAILLLAGGRNFVEGKQVRLSDRGMAGKAARYMESGGRGRKGILYASRGRMPSDTSLEEAAAVGVAAVVEVLPVVSFALYGSLGVNLVDITGADIWERGDVRGYLSGVAWRAAYASYVDDFAAEAGASIGRHAERQGNGIPLASDAGAAAVTASSVHSWEQEHQRRVRARADADLAQRATDTKNSLASWVWSALVPLDVPAAGANAARAREGAQRRARFVIRLIEGDDWTTAAAVAGFADGAAAAKVLGAAKTWAALAAAVARDGKLHPAAAELRAAAARCIRAERAARRALRPVLKTSAKRDRKSRAVRVVEGPQVRDAGAGWVWRRGAVKLAASGVMFGAWRLCPLAMTGGRSSRRVAGLRVDIWGATARALDTVQAVAQRATAARVDAGLFGARAAAAWDAASSGMRRGSLRG
jgi:hypothetical protein